MKFYNILNWVHILIINFVIVCTELTDSKIIPVQNTYHGDSSCDSYCIIVCTSTIGAFILSVITARPSIHDDDDYTDFTPCTIIDGCSEWSGSCSETSLNYNYERDFTCTLTYKNNQVYGSGEDTYGTFKIKGIYNRDTCRIAFLKWYHQDVKVEYTGEFISSTHISGNWISGDCIPGNWTNFIKSGTFEFTRLSVAANDQVDQIV